MALLKRREALPEVAVETELNYNILELRRLTDHPGVAPLLERRHGLHARLEALSQQRQALLHNLDAIERAQGEEIALQGDEWAPPAVWRKIKEDIADVEAQERMIHTGLAPLDEQIETAVGSARQEIEVRLNGLRQPLIAEVIKALESITASNRQVHTIERQAQKLLGVGSWHLFDVGLEQRLHLMRRTQALLDRAGENPDAA